MIERVFIYKYVSDDRKQLFVLWGYKTYWWLDVDIYCLFSTKEHLVMLVWPAIIHNFLVYTQGTMVLMFSESVI